MPSRASGLTAQVRHWSACEFPFIPSCLEFEALQGCRQDALIRVSENLPRPEGPFALSFGFRALGERVLIAIWRPEWLHGDGFSKIRLSEIIPNRMGDPHSRDPYERVCPCTTIRLVLLPLSCYELSLLLASLLSLSFSLLLLLQCLNDSYYYDDDDNYSFSCGCRSSGRPLR